MGDFDLGGYAHSFLNPMGPYVGQAQWAANGFKSPNQQQPGVAPYTPDRGAREADIQAGQDRARKELYDDPEMQQIKTMRDDMAKGYSGNTLGALRQDQMNQIDGARSGYLNAMQGKLARAGVGGARGAAMAASADRGFLKERAGAENKIAVQNEDAIRKGNQSLEDFMMRRKFGVLGGGLAEGSMGAQERAGVAAASAASQPSKSFNPFNPNTWGF